MAKRVLLVCVMLAISVQISQTQARKSLHMEKIEEIARERRQENEEREERREINSYGPYGWRRKRSLKGTHALTSSPHTKDTNTNKPFPSSTHSLFQNEAKCKTLLVKMRFISFGIKNHFYISSFVLSLAMKQRLRGTRKLSI